MLLILNLFQWLLKTKYQSFFKFLDKLFKADSLNEFSAFKKNLNVVIKSYCLSKTKSLVISHKQYVTLVVFVFAILNISSATSTQSIFKNLVSKNVVILHVQQAKSKTLIFLSNF
jgi:hypothetical protein